MFPTSDSNINSHKRWPVTGKANQILYALALYAALLFPVTGAALLLNRCSSIPVYLCQCVCGYLPPSRSRFFCFFYPSFSMYTRLCSFYYHRVLYSCFRKHVVAGKHLRDQYKQRSVGQSFRANVPIIYHPNCSVSQQLCY